MISELTGTGIIFITLISINFHRVAETVDVKVPKDGEFMTAECTAYSQHQPPQPRDRVWTHWTAGETASQTALVTRRETALQPLGVA